MASVAKTFKVKNGLDVVGGKSTTAASTTSYASLNLPPGSAPTSPANGDMWSTSAGLYVRINGTTVGPLGVPTWGQITGTLSNQTDLQSALDLKANLASPTFTGTVTLPTLVGSDTTDASSSTTGAFKTAGGMGIAKKLYVGTNLSVGGTATVTGASTFNGDISLSKATPLLSVSASSGVNSFVRIDGASDVNRMVTFTTSGSARWHIGVANNTAETGGNTGSNFTIKHFTDAGVEDTVFTMARDTKQAQFWASTDASSSTSGAVVISGGVGIAKKLYVGTDLTVGGALVGTTASQDVFNTVATTVNGFGAATALTLGATTGTTTIRNATVTLTNATALNINGASPAIATTSTTASVFNTNVTTLNVGGAATTISIGAGTGTTTVNNNLTVTGNLTVNGTVSTINSTTITVDDKNIELGSTASPSDTTADGGGITLKGTTDKTFNWVDATDSWTSSEHLDLASGKVLKINGTQVLSATQYTGNAATATTATTADAWTTSRTITLGGDLSGSVSLNGSANVTLTATVAANSVALGTDTTGNYVATIAGTANRVTVSGSGSETAAVTLSLPQDIHTDARPQFQAITLAQENNSAQVYFIGRGEFAPVRLDLSTNATPTTLDSWSASNYSSADYQLTFRHSTSGKMTSTLLRVLWDGTDVHYSEYGTMEATAGASDVVLTATYSSPNILVQATSATAGTDIVQMSGFVTRVRQP